MAKNKTIINIHAKRYIQAVFEARLRDEGFHCPDDKLLCWYRIRGSDMFDTVIFRSAWTNLPLSMDILYEVSPLFFAPLRTQNVNYNDSTHIRFDCLRHFSNLEKGPISEANMAPFSPDVLVYAPKHGGRGIYAFNEVILPAIDAIHTINESYQIHKEVQYRSPNKSCWFWNASREYVAEAIYVNDTEVYPYCRKRIERALSMYRDLAWMRPSNREISIILEDWELLRTALFEDGRMEFLDILEQRKIRTKRLLKKWGIINNGDTFIG